MLLSVLYRNMYRILGLYKHQNKYIIKMLYTHNIHSLLQLWPDIIKIGRHENHVTRLATLSN